MRPGTFGIASSVLGSILWGLASSPSAAAADSKAALEKIKADNQAAISAFGASDFKEMKSKLLDAVAVANESGLGENKVLAQTHVLLGVMQVDGLKETDAGIRSFAKALDINPAVEIPNGMATKVVKAAFKRAEDGDIPKEAAGKEVAGKEAAGAATPTAAAKPAEADKADKGNDKKRAEAEAADKKRAEAEAREREKQQQLQREQKQKIEQELAQAKAGESRGQAEKDKLAREKTEAEKALADAKARIALLEKEKADRDKAAADAKARIALLEKEKADRDKAAADAKARIAVLEKEKADGDKAVAATKDNEAKERAAKEKLEKELQAMEARDKQRQAQDEALRREREQDEAGPELPAHLSEPITCTVGDQVEAGADLFAHCAPRPALGAKVLSFYFRPSGSVLYNATVMERTKKGWYVALVPGSRIYGKLIQYYVEARDAKQDIVASNGKASSPNIATVRSGPVAQQHKGKH